MHDQQWIIGIKVRKGVIIAPKVNNQWRADGSEGNGVCPLWCDLVGPNSSIACIFTYIIDSLMSFVTLQ